jgi:hypothetical protein
MAEVDQLHTQLGSPWKEGRGKGFIGSVHEEGHGKRTGARRGEGASRVALGELPRRKGRMRLKWKTRL